VEKYCRVEQATDDNMAHAQCMLDTYDYTLRLRICSMYCFSTATMLHERLSVLWNTASPSDGTSKFLRNASLYSVKPHKTAVCILLIGTVYVQLLTNEELINTREQP